MRFHFAALAAFAASALAAPGKRDTAGVILSPTAGTAVSSGAAISFSYADRNLCEAGYTTVSVWLSDDVPTAVNSTGGLDDYVEYYGTYLIPNFGLPELGGSSPPPSSLTMPDLSSFTSGAPIYLTVIETIRAHTCPPEGVVPTSDEYEFTTATLSAA